MKAFFLLFPFIDLRLLAGIFVGRNAKGDPKAALNRWKP
jgi:hypothetical protein